MAKEKAPKGNTTARRVGYELIERDHVGGHPVYAMLAELVRDHHEDLRPARFAIAWNLTWQPDADGRTKIGMAKRASDLDRELAAFDFVILLRRAFWKDDRVTDEQRRALLDHELCHCARATTKGGDPAVDERGRPVWRIRKHDIEEFSEVVDRHGMWSRDLENLAAALRKNGVGPFVHCDRCALTPGWIDVLDAGGVSRKDRCECWKAWAERREEYRADQRASA
jgi:hypothetical protein